MTRIAYLLESTDLFGGVKVVLQQAEALARRGHHVAVVSPQPAPRWFSLVRAHFECSSFGQSRELAAADVRVATFFRTVGAALEGARGPVFHLCQGYEGEIALYRDRIPEIEEIYRLPTIKLAVSATLAARLETLGFGRVINVGQTFDPDDFVPGPPRPPADPPWFLVVGPREIEFKGVDVALAGFDLWRRRGGRFRLRWVSYFPPGREAWEASLADEYHTGLPPVRMPFAYRASDGFVGGSRVEEGFGLPTLEALACGIPSLLSDVPGQREIAGEAAWYFRDGDSASLAEALPALLTPEARAHARKRGPAAASRFDSDRVAVNLERAFEAALSRKANR